MDYTDKLGSSHAPKVKLRFFDPAASFIPKKMTLGSVGFDIYSPQTVVIRPGETITFPLNFAMQIPRGYYATIVSRSSMAKRGIIVPNSPAIIDWDYTEECRMILSNINQFTENPYTILKGDRVAQMIFRKCEFIDFDIVDDIEKVTDSQRSGGLGSTGT